MKLPKTPFSNIYLSIILALLLIAMTLLVGAIEILK